MRYTIERSQLSGMIRVPPSKSHSLRALLFGSLCEGKTTLRNLLHSPDTEAMKRACMMIGAKITDHGHGSYTVHGVGGKPGTPEDVIDAGNSGLVLRLFGAVAALCSGYTIITGDESIRSRRPVAPLIQGLRDLGAIAESSRGNGLAPIIIGGRIKAGATTVDTEDSQPLSGLLIASSFVPGKSTFIINHIGERPWVELTLSWLESMGVQFTNRNLEEITVQGKVSYPGFSFTVPSDYSSALFPIVAALITNSAITLTHVTADLTQGDRLVIPLLQEMGAEIEVDEEAETIQVKRHAKLKGREIDVNPFIDALPALAVIGCFAEGETRLVNAGIARKKESDRIQAMVQELSKMGAEIEELEEGLVVRPSSLRGTEVEGHQDHRVIMALAVAGLAASGKTEIPEVDSVKKSYADFFTHLGFLGANVTHRI